MGLFILTISMAVSGHTLLHVPPVIGMMTGLGLLKLYGYFLQTRGGRFAYASERVMNENALSLEGDPRKTRATSDAQYDIYRNLQRVEWDTLLFFYGIMLCVAGLGAFGYLAAGSNFMYGELGATTSNVLVGFASALFDNIPVMFAVLEMNPEMSLGQWLLITLTAGVGGSMLSIGSAAGVAVMGQARGIYTFFSHLRWSWAIVIGYGVSIWVHFLVNGLSDLTGTRVWLGSDRGARGRARIALDRLNLVRHPWRTRIDARRSWPSMAPRRAHDVGKGYSRTPSLIRDRGKATATRSTPPGPPRPGRSAPRRTVAWIRPRARRRDKP